MVSLYPEVSESESLVTDTMIESPEVYQREQHRFKIALATAIWLSLGLIWLPGFRSADVTLDVPLEKPVPICNLPRPKPIEYHQPESLERHTDRSVPLPEHLISHPEPVLTPLEAPDTSAISEPFAFLEPSLPDSVPNSATSIFSTTTQGIEPPVFISRSQPKYPPRALRVGIEGDVILEAVLSKDGSIRDIRIIKGLGEGRFGFEEAAMRALEQWTFTPGQLNGQRVDIRMSLKITFAVQR